MNLGGLSPEKAPPIEAPLSLIYLMPLFLGLAGIVLCWQGDQALASRWSPAALAATHFVVLGVLAPVMCGALLQIAPVLLGAPYPQVRLVAGLTAVGLGAGALLLGTGFLFGRPGLLLGGGLGAAAGLAVFLVASLRALADAGGRHEALWAVRLAVAALAVTITLGLVLAAARNGWLDLPERLRWVDTHAAWGLGGWVGLLLAGIGMELIPLFYISPGFSRRLKQALPVAVFGLLLAVTLLGVLPRALPLVNAALTLLFALHLVYNLGALRDEQRRQRPRRDANLWLWQVSHIGVFLAFLSWLSGASASLIGVLLLGAALSFVVGSLMKIVPFLSWLDLQQRRIAGRQMQVRLPTLRALLPDASANAIAISLAVGIALTSAGNWVAPLSQLGGAVLVVAALLLAHCLASTARLRLAVSRELQVVPGAVLP